MSSPSRGGGLGKQQEFDCDIYPTGGNFIGHRGFDLSISNSRREVNHLLLIL